jgi:DhnA family fructose-bisphosphate aldolase class Ia
MAFQTSGFFPQKLYDQITEIRINKPELITNSAERRSRPEDITYDGKLTLLAADHPARRVTTAGGDPIAIGDRYELLGRILRVLATEFDGVVGTVDVVEELLILDQLIVDAGGESFLDDALLIASVNRGGLEGAAWEMNDRPTSFSSDSLSRLRLDGIKLLLRLDLSDEASAETMDYCTRVMEDADRAGVPVFLEPLPVSKGAKGYEVNKSVEELVKTIGVASALGSSSANTWLKIPYVDNFERVARATTLPLVMLGGETQDDALTVLEMFARGMKAGANVRGVMAGRNVLFPANGEDPAAIAHAIEAIVHDSAEARAAYSSMSEARNSEMDWLMKLFK